MPNFQCLIWKLWQSKFQESFINLVGVVTWNQDLLKLKTNEVFDHDQKLYWWSFYCITECFCWKFKCNGITIYSKPRYWITCRIACRNCAKHKVFPKLGILPCYMQLLATFEYSELKCWRLESRLLNILARFSPSNYTIPSLYPTPTLSLFMLLCHDS